MSSWLLCVGGVRVSVCMQWVGGGGAKGGEERERETGLVAEWKARRGEEGGLFRS